MRKTQDFTESWQICTKYDDENCRNSGWYLNEEDEIFTVLPLRKKTKNYKNKMHTWPSYPRSNGYRQVTFPLGYDINLTLLCYIMI